MHTKTLITLIIASVFFISCESESKKRKNVILSCDYLKSIPGLNEGSTEDSRKIFVRYAINGLDTNMLEFYIINIGDTTVNEYVFCIICNGNGIFSIKFDSLGNVLKTKGIPMRFRYIIQSKDSVDLQIEPFGLIGFNTSIRLQKMSKKGVVSDLVYKEMIFSSSTFGVKITDIDSCVLIISKIYGNGFFTEDTLNFNPNSGKVLHFPKN